MCINSRFFYSSDYVWALLFCSCINSCLEIISAWDKKQFFLRSTSFLALGRGNIGFRLVPKDLKCWYPRVIITQPRSSVWSHGVSCPLPVPEWPLLSPCSASLTHRDPVCYVAAPLQSTAFAASFWRHCKDPSKPRSDAATSRWQKIFLFWLLSKIDLTQWSVHAQTLSCTVTIQFIGCFKLCWCSRTSKAKFQDRRERETGISGSYLDIYKSHSILSKKDPTFIENDASQPQKAWLETASRRKTESSYLIHFAIHNVPWWLSSVQNYPSSQIGNG